MLVNSVDRHDADVCEHHAGSGEGAPCLSQLSEQGMWPWEGILGTGAEKLGSAQQDTAVRTTLGLV